MGTSRLLIDAPLCGPVNMARDEALLESARDGEITLRFYAWQQPTISLGYFQDYAAYQRLEPPVGGLPVVRRTTGGGAILHDLEVTYSLIVPCHHAWVHDKPNNLYALAHRAIITAVGNGLQRVRCSEVPGGESTRRGPFFCFARRHPLDVLLPDPGGIGGYSKLAGSAQRRTTTAILQHGSIMLDSRHSQQPVVTWSQLAGSISFEEAVRRLVPAFERELNATLTPGAWTPEELGAAERLKGKYAGEAWTKHRQR